MTEKRELTCVAVIGVSVIRALIDMGASVSLLRETEYRHFRNWEWMRKSGIEITQADRGPMEIRGC